jgi:hypothetical protein
MAHRTKPQLPESHFDPDAVRLGALRIRAALFAARLNHRFEEILKENLVSVAEARRWTDLAADLPQTASTPQNGA